MSWSPCASRRWDLFSELKALRQAAEAVKAGDHARAQAILQPVLQTEQAQALLQKLDG